MFNTKKLVLIFATLAMLILSSGCGSLDPESILEMEAGRNHMEART